MMRLRKYLILLVTLCAARLCLAQPAAIEFTAPPEFANPAKWYAEEGVVSADAKHVRAPGGKSLCFHIPVDYTKGEAKYPIGWPRAGIHPKVSWDWRPYDYFEFWLYAETSRAALPADPLGIIISGPDKASDFHLRIPVVKGQWVKVRINTEDLPRPQEITRVQWAISESNYKHLDVVDFYFADMTLARYTQPAILSFQPLEKLIDTRTAYLPVDLHLAGAAEGAKIDASVLVERERKVLSTIATQLERGRCRVVLPMPRGLTPGPADLAVRLGSKDDAATATLTIIASPFEGS